MQGYEMEEFGTAIRTASLANKVAANQSHLYSAAPTSFFHHSSKAFSESTSTHVLGAMNLGSVSKAPVDNAMPWVNVNMFHSQDNIENPIISNNDALTEYWTCRTPVTYDVEHQWQVGQSEDFLYASIQYDDNNSDLTELTQQHYNTLFKLLEQRGFKKLLRMWNFVPRINEDDANGLERYRGFCLGRSLAFQENFNNMNMQMSAATGIGSHADENTIVVIAAKNAAEGITHLENPLQIPAYNYPKQYGPKPPSFARGTYYRCGIDGSHNLYVSGTASILASETVHQGNVGAQLNTTLNNITTLVAEQNLNNHNVDGAFTLQDMRSVKVYFRNREQLKQLKQGCQQAFGDSHDIVYLHTDICRNDLDVEIEGYFKSSTT